jgi:hypothetical protein
VSSRSYPCTIPGCDGFAFLSPFLIPIKGQAVSAIPGYLWECDTCGSLWNQDGTPKTESAERATS